LYTNPLYQDSMKIPSLFMVLLLFVINSTIGQHLPDEFLCSPILIEHSKGLGTGFLILDTADFYFVTAKHNFIDNKTNILLVEEASLTMYNEDPVTGDKIKLKLNLKEADSLGYVYKKQYEDVLAIKIAYLEPGQFKNSAVIYYSFVTKETGSTFIKALPVEILLKYEDIHVGDEIYLFGYPTSIGLTQTPQFDYSKPLLRKGIVAGKYNAKKTLILDCPSYYGNSGGPVIVKMTEMFKNISIQYRLIGLTVEFIPYEEKWLNLNTHLINKDLFNSGYSVAISSSSIIELFNMH
jgi:hypothetical protein